MTLDEYQAAAEKTNGQDMIEGYRNTLAYFALGVAGEAGEVADYVKKVVAHGHILDELTLAKEIGDVLWYCALLSKHIGLKLSWVAELNLKKLAERYPAGFSHEASINRKE